MQRTTGLKLKLRGSLRQLFTGFIGFNMHSRIRSLRGVSGSKLRPDLKQVEARRANWHHLLTIWRPSWPKGRFGAMMGQVGAKLGPSWAKLGQVGSTCAQVGSMFEPS
eukprot:12317153-Karenia_brevis.AAC.1